MDQDKEILANLSQLSWGTSSNSFDDMDIKLTKPSFGVIALLQMDDTLQNFRKNCEKFLLMRTRDNCLHMTIFQVFITFHDDYNPFSLPNNLLECLHTFITQAIKADILKINENLETLSRFVVTNNWCILGKRVSIPFSYQSRLHGSL